ncbi:N2227-domain-containing protein [Pluteus cervinus]|uniref:N2227-domain-containing protein n=1 Tax=Pluteus cervinus TaxID=181527 RepID=A0ACD3AK01_9AGAR|nr:N2227-domain-containing protein [Pluteus cervinus]
MASSSPPSNSIKTIPTSDIALACLFPLFVLFLIVKLAGPFSWTELRQLFSLRAITSSTTGLTKNEGPFSLKRAYYSYHQYRRMALTELSGMRRSYSGVGRKSKRIGHVIGYPEKLKRLEVATDLNSVVTEQIAEVAISEFGLDVGELESGMSGMRPRVGDMGELGRVRESLKHFVRDWSEAGKVERVKIFTPILDALKQVVPLEEERKGKKVLVPGSGLGRLAWEISQLGFDTTANELSFFMNLAFRFLLSPNTTTITGQHSIRPFAHWFSHQRSNVYTFRSIAFPDVVPRLGPTFRLIEDDFLALRPSATDSSKNTTFWSNTDRQGEEGSYDFIVTLFFIDTSLDVLTTLEQIHTLLRPGGIWINLGPLLWTAGGQAKVELSLEEVLQAAEETGFIISGRGGDDVDDVMKPRTVECEYTSDSEAMMRWTYKAEFWVAHRSKL